MSKLKLGPIADDKPLKVQVELPAALHQDLVDYAHLSGLTHQCLYFEQPHTFEQILFIQTAEPALVGHA